MRPVSASTELKNRLHAGALRHKTVPTAVQELAGRGRVPPLRMLQMLWPVLETCQGLLSRGQQRELIRRMEERLLRQPVTERPRLQRNRYQQGTVEVEVTRIKK